MPPYCRGSKHQKNGLAPLEERKRLCDPSNLPNLISFICLFPINMQPLALFLRKEPGGLSSISTACWRWFFLLRPLLHLVRMIFHPVGRGFLRRLSFLDHQHHFFHVLSSPAEPVHDPVSLRIVLFQSLPDQGVNVFRFPEGFLRVLQELQFHLGKFPVRLPT